MSEATSQPVHVRLFDTSQLIFQTYLAAAQSFHDSTEVLMLTTNLIRKDINSTNMYDCGVALGGLACFVTPDLARDLASDIVNLKMESYTETLPNEQNDTLVSHEPNDDISELSGGNTPPPPILTINEGSLTLAQFVGWIEARSGRVVSRLFAGLRHRLYQMPVTAPQQNVDHFEGQGQRLVEDVVYGLAGRQRLAIHGIIEIQVFYLGRVTGDIMNYQF